MLIKVIRTNKSRIGHAILYAESENPDTDFYLSSTNQKMTSIKLDFNRHDATNIFGAHQPQFDAQALFFNPPANDEVCVSHSVQLSSTLPFKEFCEKLIANGYETNISYHLLTNSCVDAVRFALKTAGIDVQLNKPPIYKRISIFSQYHDIITSHDLLTALQDMLDAVSSQHTSEWQLCRSPSHIQ